MSDDEMNSTAPIANSISILPSFGEVLNQGNDFNLFTTPMPTFPFESYVGNGNFGCFAPEKDHFTIDSEGNYHFEWIDDNNHQNTSDYLGQFQSSDERFSSHDPTEEEALAPPCEKFFTTFEPIQFRFEEMEFDYMEDSREVEFYDFAVNFPEQKDVLCAGNLQSLVDKIVPYAEKEGRLVDADMLQPLHAHDIQMTVQQDNMDDVNKEEIFNLLALEYSDDSNATKTTYVDEEHIDVNTVDERIVMTASPGCSSGKPSGNIELKSFGEDTSSSDGQNLSPVPSISDLSASSSDDSSFTTVTSLTDFDSSSISVSEISTESTNAEPTEMDINESRDIETPVILCGLDADVTHPVCETTIEILNVQQNTALVDDMNEMNEGKPQDNDAPMDDALHDADHRDQLSTTPIAAVSAQLTDICTEVITKLTKDDMDELDAQDTSHVTAAGCDVNTDSTDNEICNEDINAMYSGVSSLKCTVDQTTPLVENVGGSPRSRPSRIKRLSRFMRRFNVFAGAVCRSIVVSFVNKYRVM